jgi:hypothetical protein
MRSVFFLLSLACFFASSSAAEGVFDDPNEIRPSIEDLKPVPENQIRLPILPPGPTPTPPPQPVVPDVKPVDPPAPQEVTDLKSDQFFVIEADVPFFVLDSRVGLVSIAYDQGPIRLRGKFADGKGTVETRTYQSKYLATVEAVTKGQVELLVVPAGATDSGVVIRRTLTVMGQAPQPPPGPGPQPDPDDPPAPIPGDSNRVLIIYESSELSKYSPEQSTIFAAAKIREYLNRTCSKGPDGKTPEYRIWDKDVDTGNVSKVWQDAVKMPRASLPWIIVSNGTTGFSGPLPGTVDETITLLKKHLGD